MSVKSPNIDSLPSYFDAISSEPPPSYSELTSSQLPVSRCFPIVIPEHEQQIAPIYTIQIEPRGREIRSLQTSARSSKQNQLSNCCSLLCLSTLCFICISIIILMGS